MSQTPKIAVVVPVLNEAAVAADLANRLLALSQRDGVEVIVVDGGSRDDTVAQLVSAGLTVTLSGRGRAAQMNHGATKTRAPTLLFLHADSVLPDGAIDDVLASVNAGAVWGRFDVCIAGRSRWFPLISAMINLRSRWSGVATGDQAIFVRRLDFDAVGAYPQQPLMEDVELSRQLCKRAQPDCLTSKVTTSGRRWEQHGVWRTVVLMWRLRFAYWRGVPAEKLAALYA